MDSPKTLQQAVQFFSEYENCRQFMVFVRWPDGKVRCPYCNAEKLTYLEKAKIYRCYGDHPKQKFSLKIGTIFEDSPIGLDKWLPAVWLIVNCKNGVSSYELHRALGVTQKSAWFMLHRVRLAMQSQSFEKFGGGPEGSEVEADETFIGGKAKNMHKDKKLRLTKLKNEFADGQYPHSTPGSLPGKSSVIGVLDREQRKVRARVVPNVRREVLQNNILKEVALGSKVYTPIRRTPMTDWRRSTLMKSSTT